MNANVKKLWVEALRSGKYKQGQSRLKYTRDGKVKHCCLGVLCEVFKEDNTRSENLLSISIDALRENSSFLSVPSVIATEIGLESGNPLVSLSETIMEELGNMDLPDHSLAALNDAGLTFSAIADIIQEQF